MNITAAQVTRYTDSGQKIAHVSWVDSKGKTGTTSGCPRGLHMMALLARAEREGLKVARVTW